MSALGIGLSLRAPHLSEVEKGGRGGREGLLTIPKAWKTVLLLDERLWMTLRLREGGHKSIRYGSINSYFFSLRPPLLRISVRLANLLFVTIQSVFTYLFGCEQHLYSRQ